MTRSEKKSWNYYKNWRQHGSYAPLLKAHVKVSLKGWYHITGKTKYRKTSDISRRLSLLPVARSIIESSTATVSIRNKHGHKFYALERQLIRVVIIQDQSANLIFLSVMDKKIKKHKKSPRILRLFR